MSKKEILRLLNDFVSFRSISAGGGDNAHLQQAVSFLVKKLSRLDFKVRVIRNGQSPPLIFACRFMPAAKKTIALYGHYDVQPADPLDKWQHPPFQLTVTGGKLYGRGVADNKGHIIENIIAVANLLKREELKNNIIFLLEGEEESGSVNFQSLLKKISHDLNAVDVFVVTDMGMFEKNRPQIFYALRGLLYCELIITVGQTDLHSGIFGNLVFNPYQLLAELISNIKDSRTGKITLEGFNRGIKPILPAELRLLQNIKRPLKDLQLHAQTKTIVEKIGKIPAYLTTKVLPSFEVHGMWGGYTGVGAKTVIPAQAGVKFSFRLVEGQRVTEMIDLIKNLIRRQLPKGVQWELKILGAENSFYIDFNDPVIKKVKKILTQYFHHSTLLNRSGGSVPAATVLQELFHKPLVLTGFTLPDAKIHAPNENFDEEMFWAGIGAMERIINF